MRSFYEEEISIRRSMYYPPFSNILLINMSSKNENILIKNIQRIAILLKNKLADHDKIEVMGPCPCIISKIKEMFRWQIMIKGKIDLDIAQNVKKTVYNLIKDVYSDIKISIDINPNSTI